MKRPKGNQFPYSVRQGSVSVRIYRSQSAKGYESFFVTHHLNGTRHRKSFAIWDDAYEHAQGVALKLAQGEIQVAQLTAPGRTSYGHASFPRPSAISPVSNNRGVRRT
jgi:hypothetical protein